MAGCLTAAPNWQQILANCINSWLYIWITLTFKFLSKLMNKWLNKSRLKIFLENRVSQKFHKNPKYENPLNFFFLNWFLLNSLWLVCKFGQFGNDVFFLIALLCFERFLWDTLLRSYFVIFFFFFHLYSNKGIFWYIFFQVLGRNLLIYRHLKIFKKYLFLHPFSVHFEIGEKPVLKRLKKKKIFPDQCITTQ